MSIDPAVAALLVGCMTLLFAGAAVHKLRDLRQFDAVFSAYRLLPWGGRLIPVVEVLVAAGLLLQPARRGAALLGALLLLAYAGAIAINLRRGRTDLDCGCMGPAGRRPIAPWMVGRNVLLAMLTGLLLLPWTVRAWTATDALTVGLGTATLALLYLCVDGLLALGGRNPARLAHAHAHHAAPGNHSPGRPEADRS